MTTVPARPSTGNGQPDGHAANDRKGKSSEEEAETGKKQSLNEEPEILLPERSIRFPDEVHTVGTTRAGTVMASSKDMNEEI
jgi:hypothetical protein